MNLKLWRSSDETELALSSYFLPQFGETRLRLRAVEKYNQDGGQPTGDRNAEPRRIRLVRTNAETTDTAYINAVNEALEFLIDGSDFYYLIDTTTDRRARVEVDRVGDENDNGLARRVGRESISLLWLNAAWEDNTENEESSASGGTSAGGTLSVTNGQKLRCYAIFEVTPVSTDIPEFTLRNTTNGAAITISNAAFVVGTTIHINGVTGAVELEDGAGNRVSSSASVADNTGFIPLDAGANTIRYETAYGAANITVKWRERRYF